MEAITIRLEAIAIATRVGTIANKERKEGIKEGMGQYAILPPNRCSTAMTSFVFMSHMSNVPGIIACNLTLNIQASCADPAVGVALK